MTQERMLRAVTHGCKCCGERCDERADDRRRIQVEVRAGLVEYERQMDEKDT